MTDAILPAGVPAAGEIFSLEDLFIGWRCMRQLRRRLDQRRDLQNHRLTAAEGASDDRPAAGAAEVSGLQLTDFLELPVGSAGTHQFLEKYRIQKAYRQDFLSAVGTADDAQELREIYPGSMICFMEDIDAPLATIVDDSRMALADFAAGKLSALVSAAIIADRRLVIIDRLTRTSEGRIRLEIAKASTKIKDSYVREAAWVTQGLESIGIIPDEIFVLLLNRDYPERSSRFYSRDRQKRRHKFMRIDFSAEIDRLIHRLGEGSWAPCKNPTCDLCAHEQPRKSETGSIHQLHKSGGLSQKLAAEGIHRVEDLHLVSGAMRSRLKKHHWIQHEAEKSGLEHVDRTGLENFFNGLSWPLYFLDFECYLEALPSWDSVGVWEHVPFLYSMYSMDRTGKVIRHDHQLIRPGGDSREDMARALIRDLGSGGSILVYGVHFERAILKRLADAFPELASGLQAIIDRLVDAQKPFADFLYYHPEQRGKISLKVVLPLLTEHDYRSETVSNGSDAFVGYYYLMHPGLRVDTDWDEYASRVRENPEEFFRDVVEYCDTDTYGLAYLMLALMQKMKKDV